jgi:hypothetical protein
MLIVFVLVPITALVTIIFLSSVDVHNASYSNCTFFFLLLLVCLPFLYPYLIQKQFKRIFPSGQTDQSIRIDIDDERIISSFSEIVEVKYFWNAIPNFVKNEKVAMLYVSKCCFLLVPIASLTPEQRTELNDLVARHVVRKK